MYDIFNYIWLIFMVDVCKYTSPMDSMGSAKPLPKQRSWFSRKIDNEARHSSSRAPFSVFYDDGKIPSQTTLTPRFNFSQQIFWRFGKNFSPGKSLPRKDAVPKTLFEKPFSTKRGGEVSSNIFLGFIFTLKRGRWSRQTAYFSNGLVKNYQLEKNQGRKFQKETVLKFGIASLAIVSPQWRKRKWQWVMR